MGKTGLVSLALLMVFIAGCMQNGPRCSPPYLETVSGSCCLDANQNGVCDKYEKGAESTVKTSVAIISTVVTSIPPTSIP